MSWQPISSYSSYQLFFTVYQFSQKFYRAVAVLLKCVLLDYFILHKIILIISMCRSGTELNQTNNVIAERKRKKGLSD